MTDAAPPATAPVHVTCGSPQLRPAEPNDLLEALAFALRFRGRKRVNNAVDVMAQITAERIVEHLAISGFVVMKKLPAPAHST